MINVIAIIVLIYAAVIVEYLITREKAYITKSYIDLMLRPIEWLYWCVIGVLWGALILVGKCEEWRKRK